MNNEPLTRYLRVNGIRRVDFAKISGVSLGLVNKLCAPKWHQCSLGSARKIVQATGGAVTLEDLCAPQD